jgi:TetR/AcrR family transcriptional regulator, regulator of biofilm formation and stress response
LASRRIPVRERRQALVEAAMRVMEREGIAAATTRSICAEAGMPNGFFHYCFTSKQELMLEVAQQFRRRFTAMLSLADGLHGDIYTVLSTALTTLLDDAAAHPDIHQLTYELPLYALRDDDLSGIAQLCYEDNELVSAEFLRVAADIAGCEWTEPVDKLARFLAVTVDGTVLQWLMLRDDDRAHEHIDVLARHIAALARPLREGEPAAAAARARREPST